MEKRFHLNVLIAVSLFAAGVVQAVTPQPQELRLRDEWLDRTSLKGSALPAPFSFLYDGKPLASLLKGWQAEHSSQKLDAQHTQHTVVYADPATGLQVRSVAIEYGDFPTVEWTLYVKNTGSADTPIIEKIQALDIELGRGTDGEFLLHHNVGSPANGNDYGPLETPLGRKATKRLGGSGGDNWSHGPNGLIQRGAVAHHLEHGMTSCRVSNFLGTH